MRKIEEDCGCTYTVDKRGREEWTQLCMEHEIEFITRHAAAVSTCSHVHRDRNSDLVGG